MPFRLLLLVALVAVLAPQAHADVSVRVCNTGQLNVEAAVAYETYGLFAGGWVISAWRKIAPGGCDNVYHDPNACQNVFNQWTACARVYVAYAFRDSTGVWGAANFKDSKWYPRGENICVSMAGVGETRPTSDAYCAKPGWFLIPVNAKVEPRDGNYRPEFSQAYPGQTVNVALTTRDRAIPLGPAATPGKTAAPAPSANDNSGLGWAAGLGAAIIVGAIINEMANQSNCNTPVPKPFERGTLNAEFLRMPVVRRTCDQADWYVPDRGFTLQKYIGTDNRSTGSVLDPPQQVDSPGKADSAADPRVRQIIAALDTMLGSRGRTNITNYGKFRYQPAGENTNEVWLNVISLEFFRSTYGTQSGAATMTIPCANDYTCALHLMRREGYIKAQPSITLHLQGRGNWDGIVAEINKLKAIFPKQPVVQAK